MARPRRRKPGRAEAESRFNGNTFVQLGKSRMEDRRVFLAEELGKWFRDPTDTPLPDAFTGNESMEAFEARKIQEHRAEGDSS